MSDILEQDFFGTPVKPENSLTLLPLDDWPPDYGDQFWDLYPRRIAKISAMKALAKVRKTGVPWAKVKAGVLRYASYAATRESQYIKHPTTWLNGGCWDDEAQTRNKPSFFDIAIGRNDDELPR